MRKRIAILLSVLLVMLSGCGTKETVKTEEEIRAEVLAELEAEEALKEELRAEIEAELTEETNELANEESNVEVVNDTAVDIRDEDKLYEFIVNNYANEFNNSYTKEEFESYFTMAYGDYTGNGTEDVVYYVSFDTGRSEEPLFITADKGELERIDDELETFVSSPYIITIDGIYILHVFNAYGTGLSGQNLEIFVYDGNEIVKSGARFALEGGESQMPTSSYPEGYVKHWTGSIDGNYDDFIYTYERVDGIEDVVDKREKSHYVYDVANHQYTITVIEEYSLDLSQNDSEDKEEASSNTSSESSTSNSDYYDPANLTIGTAIGGFNVLELEYEEGHSIKIELAGEEVVEGSIKYYFDGMYEENVYRFVESGSVLDKPVQYVFNSGYVGGFDSYSADIRDISFLSEDELAYLHEVGSIQGFLVMNVFGYAAKDESSNYAYCSISMGELMMDGTDHLEGNTNNDNASLIPIDLTLDIMSFEELYQPLNTSVVEWFDEMNGGEQKSTTLEYDGLKVVNTVDKTNYGDPEYMGIDNIVISSNNYVIDPNLLIGLTLEEGYAYLESMYEHTTSIHDPNPIDGMYNISGTIYAITLNDYRFTTPEDLLEEIKSIQIFKSASINGV